MSLIPWTKKNVPNTNPCDLLQPPQTPPSCTQFTASIRKFIQQHPPAKTIIKTASIKAFLNEASLPTRSSLRSLKTKPIFTQISTQISPSLSKTVTAPTPTTALPKIAFPRRISTEQYHRILAANSLHYSTAHTPDKKLCYELNHGKHQYSNLTSTDLILMRQVLGPVQIQNQLLSDTLLSHCLLSSLEKQYPSIHKSFPAQCSVVPLK